MSQELLTAATRLGTPQCGQQQWKSLVWQHQAHINQYHDGVTLAHELARLAPGTQWLDPALAHGLVFGVADQAGQTPLHHACRRQDETAAAIVDWLIRVGKTGDIDAPGGPQGWTPLHLASYGVRHVMLIRTLVAHGGSLETCIGHRQWTPLHIAARSAADPNMVLALLQAGSTPAASDQQGMTAWHLAQYNPSLRTSARVMDLLYDAAHPGIVPAARRHRGWNYIPGQKGTGS